jgi:alpha-L-rhamnosidase
MRRILALFLSAQIICSTLSAQIRVLNLLTENRTNPIGLDKRQPRFSWQLISKERNLIQSAYEIKVTLQGARTPVWSSGKILSDQSVQVPYRGMPLE